VKSTLEADPFGQVILDRLLRPRTPAPGGRRGLYHQKQFGSYNQAPDPAATENQANLIGSLDLDSVVKAQHYPVIDIDHDAYLLPSSTPGHHHLYIQHAVPHDEYLAMLDAMAAAGIVEEGFVNSARRRGQTYAIKPGLRWQGGRKGY
jgi:hypothetical protein